LRGLIAARRQRLDRQIGARVFEDVRLQIAQRLALGELAPQLR